MMLLVTADHYVASPIASIKFSNGVQVVQQGQLEISLQFLHIISHGSAFLCLTDDQLCHVLLKKNCAMSSQVFGNS
jgi:hypothetical protein